MICCRLALRDVQDRYPLLQDKVCLQWSDGIPAIVRNLKGLLVEDRGIENDGKQMWDPKGVAIDLSHRQSKWGTFTTLIKNHPGLHFRDIEQGITKHELGSSSVLVVALPYHCEFTDDNEIQNIKDWVARGGGLLLLGYYFADTHHESNPSKLARAFGLEFSNDLIMPTDRTSYRDCQDQAFEYDEALSVIFQLPSSHVHPIAEGVKNIAFLSACSIKKGSLPEPEYAIKTPLSSVIHPKGRPSTEGYLLQINEYVEAAKDAVTVLAAWQYGQGRLVASGTWKVATFAYGNNTILVRNTLNWLSQPHAI